MSKWVIGTEDFNRNLDDWLFQNNQKNAEWLFKNKNKIPPNFRSYSGVLYRGMTVDADFLNKLDENKMVFVNHTSWTKDKKIAENFVNDKRFAFTKNAGTKIIIAKKITPNEQIIDIESFVLFMGMDQLEMMGFDDLNLDSALKEHEVLISKKIKINKKDVTFI